MSGLLLTLPIQVREVENGVLRQVPQGARPETNRTRLMHRGPHESTAGGTLVDVGEISLVDRTVCLDLE